MEVDVFDRTSTNDPIISPTAYNLAIGLTLCWGFAINWLMVVNIDPLAIASIEPWVFFLAILLHASLEFISLLDLQTH